MDDEPIWAADHVVALILDSAITIPETANEFAIKGNHLTLVKGNQFDGRTKTDPHKHIHEFLGICDMFKYRDTENEAVRLMIDDEDDEPAPQPKTKTPKPVTETPLPKPYKPKIPYPQCLRKEKMEAQYGKFLDMIRAVRINVPLVDVLARMPNCGKFLKELISNKHKIEQIFVAFLSDESSAMIQNKVPPKLRDPGSFLIPCNFNKTFFCNALADLGASINLMLYSLYAKLSLKTLKPTKMSVRLADRSFQYPVGIAKNMLVDVGKFTFPADFVILKMEEDIKVPLILGQPFLHTADATSLEEPPADLELKPLPDNLEYVFLEEPSFLPVIIASKLSAQNKIKLESVLKERKEAFAWKTTDIPGICPSFCKHKIQLPDDKKPVVQK
ncbi:reverse transcriptase domain-containing protein [Tanacetum coccineum]